MSHRFLFGTDADLLIVASPVQDPDTVLPDKVDLSVSKYADDVVKIFPAEEMAILRAYGSSRRHQYKASMKRPAKLDMHSMWTR